MNPRQAGPALRELGLAWLHLAVLWAFAFAQPLFGVLADSPEFYVARRNTAGDIVVFACVLILVPPSVLTALEALFLRLPSARRLLHCGFVAILAAAFALQVLDDLLGAAAGVLVALAVVIGAAAGLAYARVAGVPMLLTVLSPAPLLFLGNFLLLSPVSDLVLAQTEDTGAAGRGGSGAPVVMVVFDEFSGASLLDARHRIDRTRFPNLARLAEDATWYRNATTVADRTDRAVPALLTGRLERDALPIASAQPNSLFTLLGERYEFHVIEPATDLCPKHLCGQEARPSTSSRLRSLVDDMSVVALHLLLPDGLAEGLPPIDRTFGDFGGQGRDRTARAPQSSARDIPAEALLNRISSFDAFLRDLGRGRPTRALHFIHVALPHRPWQYLPDGREYRRASDAALPGTNSADATLAQQALQQYMLQAVYVDRLTGRLLARLRATELYDRAAVVVVADHGISFRPGADQRLARAETLGEIGGVPLLMKAPRQHDGRVDDTNVHTVDVVPKLASQLGLEIPWETSDTRRRGVEVLNAYGISTNMSFARWLHLRDAAAAQIYGSFGPGIAGLFQPGVDGKLVGRSVEAFPSDSPSSVRAELDTFGQLDEVDLAATPLPVDIAGRLEGSVRPGGRLAIAMNGIVAATTRSFGSGDDTRFDAVVLPASLRAGSNVVELFAIGKGPAGPVLSPMPTVQTRTYDLVEDEGREVVKTPSGEAVPVTTGAADGFVEHLDQEGGTRGSLTVVGWAVSAAGRPVDRLVLFEGDRFLATTTPTGDRPDVAQARGPNALKSGFAIVVPSAGIYGRGLRVLAIAGGRASELERLGSR